MKDWIRDRVAGLDVHRDTVVACCRMARSRPVRSRWSNRASRRRGEACPELARFLADQATADRGDGGHRCVLEEPVLLRWSGLFPELWLCNAQHVKNVPGRKSDLSDAEWLADVAAHGMVRPSFVPPPEIRELGVELEPDTARPRSTARAMEIQRLEKALQDAGLKITSSDLPRRCGACRRARSSRRSWPANETLAVLAQMAYQGEDVRTEIDRLEEALSGHFGALTPLSVAQIIEHIDFLDRRAIALVDLGHHRAQSRAF